MKHFLLLATVCICINYSYAQIFNWQSYSHLQNYTPTNYQNRFFVHDSLAYFVQSGGLQILNINTGQSEYRWKGHYNIQSTVADSAGQYVFLRDSSTIMRYNSISGKHENIADNTFTDLISQIGISPDYKIWATSGTRIGIFNGSAWQWTNFGAGNNLTHLLVVNDSVAFARDNANHNIFRFFKNQQPTLLHHYNNHMRVYDWVAADPSNLWIAASDTLLHIQNNTVIAIPENNLPGAFYRVGIKNNGDIIVGGGNYLYTVYGISISTPEMTWGNIEAISKNKSGSLDILVNSYNGYDSLYLATDTSFLRVATRTFFPYQNINTLNAYPTNYISTNEGLFTYSDDYYDFFSPTSFSDTATFPYANDVTCFPVAQYGYLNNSNAYGTNHGVLGININNSLLPDTNINYIYYDNSKGEHYICTNKGLCIYNGSTYITYDTANSPLPSQKITFAITGYNNRFYIGTDNGVGIYTNGQWQIFDTTNVNLSSFYVTDILPPDNFYYDTSIYVTTLGSGLVLLNYNGTSKVKNTQNGQFADDSLYYVEFVQLGKCGAALLIGTGSHGIAMRGYYDTIVYWQGNSYIDSFQTSRLLIMGDRGVIAVTDRSFLTASICGGISETGAQNTELKWHDEPGEILIFTPEDFNGTAQLLVSDVLGRTIIKRSETLQSSQTLNIDVSSLPKGVYIVQLSSKDKLATAKVVVR